MRTNTADNYSPTVHTVTQSLPASYSASPFQHSPPGIDEYKTIVARHLVAHNPERIYNGILPPLLPAIVVLVITVDAEGRLAEVRVQRSRDPDASEVALAAVRRSTPLPAPRQLAASGRVTFLETFLFADDSRYQLRSLAPRQASE